VESRPVIKISGKRYTAKYLTMGAYRQLVLLMEDVKNLDELEFQDDAVEIIKEAFSLTQEQADKINAADVVPVFRLISRWATTVFTEKVKQLPNAQSPEATPGQV